MDVPQQTVCAQCRNPAKKKCGRCNSVAYCSKECQIAHWPLHKDDCALIVKFAMESDPMVEIGVKRKAEDQPTEEVERRPEKRVRKDVFSLDKLSPELLLDIIKLLDGADAAALGTTSWLFASLIRDKAVVKEILYRRYGNDSIRRNRALLHLVNSDDPWRALEYTSVLGNAWANAQTTSEHVNMQFDLPMLNDDLIYGVACTAGNGPIFVWTKSGINVLQYRQERGEFDHQTFKILDEDTAVHGVYYFKAVGDVVVAVYIEGPRSTPNTEIESVYANSPVTILAIRLEKGDLVVRKKTQSGVLTRSWATSTITVEASPEFVCIFIVHQREFTDFDYSKWKILDFPPFPDAEMEVDDSPQAFSEVFVYTDLKNLHPAAETLIAMTHAAPNPFTSFKPRVHIDGDTILLEVVSFGLQHRRTLIVMYNLSHDRTMKAPKLLVDDNNSGIWFAAGGNLMRSTYRDQTLVTVSPLPAGTPTKIVKQDINFSGFESMNPVVFFSRLDNVGWCLATHVHHDDDYMYIWTMPKYLIITAIKKSFDTGTVSLSTPKSAKEKIIKTGKPVFRTLYSFDGERFVMCYNKHRKGSPDKSHRFCGMNIIHVQNVFSDGLRILIDELNA